MQKIDVRLASPLHPSRPAGATGFPRSARPIPLHDHSVTDESARSLVRGSDAVGALVFLGRGGLPMSLPINMKFEVPKLKAPAPTRTPLWPALTPAPSPKVALQPEKSEDRKAKRPIT